MVAVLRREQKFKMKTVDFVESTNSSKIRENTAIE